jgi:hypothetical protein
MSVGVSLQALVDELDAPIERSIAYLDAKLKSAFPCRKMIKCLWNRMSILRKTFRNDSGRRCSRSERCLWQGEGHEATISYRIFRSTCRREPSDVANSGLSVAKAVCHRPTLISVGALVLALEGNPD